MVARAADDRGRRRRTRRTRRGVDVRLSRAVGLPAAWPDVHGLAVRWYHQGRRQEILLSSCAPGRLGRFVLTARRESPGAFTTLMPFATDAGAVVVGARLGRPRSDGGLDVELLRSRGAGPWRPWGRLELYPTAATDAPEASRFDPVLHSPDGLRAYRWAAALRVPAYRAARRPGRADAVNRAHSNRPPVTAIRSPVT